MGQGQGCDWQQQCNSLSCLTRNENCQQRSPDVLAHLALMRSQVVHLHCH
jgi:hypothetical protein